MLLAGCVGYLLCIWQALCTAPPLPAIPESASASGRPQESYSLDLAGPLLNPEEARKILQARLAAGTAPAAVASDSRSVRGPLFESRIVRGIDPAHRHPQDPDSWARRALTIMWNKSRAVFKPSPIITMASLFPPPPPGGRPALAPPPGALAARFESGVDGASSVGHTPRAGTSYGTFQIASGTPTYDNFLRFLETRAPEWHARLRGKGPANTGGVDGPVPQEWRNIARENPQRFERLQYEFILLTHYRPALQEIYETTGLNISALSPAVREVLWSSVVQHGVGGGVALFVSAIEAIKPRILEERHNRLFEQALIEEVYACRLNAFGVTAQTSRGAMANRYSREKTQALGLLDRHYSGT